METSSNNSSTKTAGSAQDTPAGADFEHIPDPHGYGREVAQMEEPELIPFVEGCDDFERVDLFTRNTIIRMKQSNLLIQFPQDEYQAPIQRPASPGMSEMVVKRPLYSDDEETKAEGQRGHTVALKSESQLMRDSMAFESS